MSSINTIGGNSNGLINSGNIIISDAVTQMLAGESRSLQEFIEAIDDRIDSLSSPSAFYPEVSYYLDSFSGSDENDGLSSQTAFLSIEKLYEEIYKQNIRFGLINIYIQGDNNNYLFYLFTTPINAEVISFYLGDINTRFSGSILIFNQKHIIIDESYLASEALIEARKCDYIGLEEINLIGSSRVLLKDSFCIYNRAGSPAPPIKTFTDLTGTDSTITIENVHLFSHSSPFACIGNINKSASVYKLKNVSFSILNISNFENFSSIELPEIINLDSFQNCKILISSPVSVSNGFGITAARGGIISLPSKDYLSLNRNDSTVALFDETTNKVEGLYSLKDLKVAVSDYGVAGNGIADDTAAIQAALDEAGQLLEAKQSLGLSGQTIVELPGGTFKISAPLIVRNGTTLKGQTQAPPYPNRLSGFKSNNNLFTGTEIVCSSNFVGESAIILEPDNTNIENCIIDGHAIPCGTTWTQVNVTTAQGKWISTAFIKFPVQDPLDPRIQSFKFDNVEIPYFRVGEYGEFQLQAIGGSGSYTFSLLSGSLPTGLSLSASGLISGTPTQIETVFPVFNINDGTDDFSRSFTMGTILDEIKTREILPPTAEDSYSFQLESQYGVSGLIWEAIALPDWLSLSANGFLTNNRPITTDDVAFFEFKAELYSGSTLLDKRAFKSEVRYADGAVRIFGEQRLKPQQGMGFSYQYLGSGGYGDYTWSINAARSAIAGNATIVTANSPFSGLTLNTDTGEITGTPTTTGTNTYYLRATSNTDPTLFFEGLFYLEAVTAGATPRIYTRSFKTATKGQSYSFQFNLEDIPSAHPYVYEAINLPTGLNMDSSGLITGTPTGANFVNGVQIQWSDSLTLPPFRFAKKVGFFGSAT